MGQRLYSYLVYIVSASWDSIYTWCSVSLMGQHYTWGSVSLMGQHYTWCSVASWDIKNSVQLA